MNQLKEIIKRNYSSLPKSQTLKITLDVCKQQMKNVSEISNKQINVLKENEILLNLNKLELYSIIYDGLLELLKDYKDFDKISLARDSISTINRIIENETLNYLESGNNEVQEKIINNIIIPNYLIEWTLNSRPC